MRSIVSYSTILKIFILSFSLTLNARAACPAPGTGIVANGTTVSDSNCTITTSTNNSPGILAQALANVTLSNSTILTSNPGSEGARVSNSLVTLNNVAITTIGNSNGLFVSQAGHVVMNGGSIAVGGASAFGMQVVGANSQVDLNDVTIQITAAPSSAGTGLLANNIGGAGIINGVDTRITVTASNATGIFANGTGTQINLDHATIAVNGGTSSGAGVRALGGGFLSLTNRSSVTTTGNTVYGLLLDTASTGSLVNTDIATSGNFAFGTYIQNASLLQMNHVNVETLGTNAYGLIAIGANTKAIGDHVSYHTAGGNAYGLFLYNGSEVNLNNSDVGTGGLGASAIVVAATPGITNNLIAQNTNFAADNATLILADSGNANITFTNVTGNAAAGQRFMLVDDANLNFVAHHSTLSGDIHVNSTGSANLEFLNQTLFTGAIDPANLLIDASSVWNLTGNSILNNLTNAGIINFVANGNNFKTLTVNNNYDGQLGVIGLNTYLGTDGSPSDLLVINGGSALGLSGLVISNTNGPGALTNGNGILVVDAINNGVTSLNAFYLTNPVVAGPYEYLLFRGATDGTSTENWYLRSNYNPAPTPTPVPRPIPIYRREVSLAAAIPSTVLLYDQFIRDTLHQRVGDQEQLMGRQASQLYVNGAWLRAIEQNGTYRNNSIYQNGPTFDYYFNALEMGIDVYHEAYSNGSSSYAGILGAYGKEQGNVQHLNIISLGQINAGRTNFNAWTIGGYFTHYDPSGWYIDSVLSENYHQITASSQRGLPPILANGSGVNASLEGGYQFKLAHGFGIEPEAQLVYEHLWLDNSRHSPTLISFEGTNSFIGRLGARLTHIWEEPCFIPNPITGWLFGNMWHEFQGDSRTNFASLTGNIPFSSNIHGTSTQVGIGATAMVTHEISIYGNGNYTKYWNHHGNSGGGELGIRFNL